MYLQGFTNEYFHNVDNINNIEIYTSTIRFKIYIRKDITEFEVNEFKLYLETLPDIKKVHYHKKDYVSGNYFDFYIFTKLIL